jgi:hypothetical protein
MRLAIHAPGAALGPAAARHSRAFPLVPATLLVVGMLGFAWVQISADAKHPSAAPTATAPANAAAMDATAGVVEAAPPSASPAPASGRDAASATDEVPSLEDQELASYSTCGA